MLRFTDGPSQNSRRRAQCTQLLRREWLRIGGLAGLNWAFPSFFPRSSRASDPDLPRAAGFGRAKSVIIVFTSGGQSQHETWDPKPRAPLEVRGEFGSIDTAVPGLRICEHLPRIARVADKLTAVRTMSHEDVDHGTASVYSIVLAGAGVTRGAVVGESDAQGAYPLSERYAPWDVIATIFSELGIDPQTEYTSPQGQLMRVCDGRVIEAVYG